MLSGQGAGLLFVSWWCVCVWGVMCDVRVSVSDQEGRRGLNGPLAVWLLAVCARVFKSGCPRPAGRSKRATATYEQKKRTSQQAETETEPLSVAPSENPRDASVRSKAPCSYGASTVGRGAIAAGSCFVAAL